MVPYVVINTHIVITHRVSKNYNNFCGNKYNCTDHVYIAFQPLQATCSFKRDLLFSTEVYTLVMNSGKWPTWRTILLYYMFISILCMFRATSLSSSGELIVSIQRLVCVTLCKWPSSIQATYTEWHIPDVVLIQLILLMMSTRLL
jgi:hypothetical protein